MSASARSLFHIFCVLGSRMSWYNRVNKFAVTFSGYVLHRIVGPMTLADIVLVAARTLSGSTKIFGRLGAMMERISTTSSALRFRFDEGAELADFSGGGNCEVLME